MRKAGLGGIVLALALAAPAWADQIGSGHITIGSPHTAIVTTSELGLADDVDSFFLDAPAAGTVITTETVDNSGLGYDLDVYFWSADGDYVESDCQTEAVDETCAVPAGATEVEVAAFFGHDLDVNVLTVP